MKPDFSLFSDNLDYALGWMVIHSLWQATLIAFISGVLMLILRKKTAKLRYIVANIALLAVVVSAVVTFCLYYDFATEPAKVTFTPTTELMGAETINTTVSTEIQNPKSETDNPLSISGFKDYFNKNIPLIVTVWILGVAIFMLKLLGGISYIYYLKKRMNFPADEYWTDMLQKLADKAGLQKGIDIVESAMVRTPMVVGHLKPLILFPMGIINRLTPEEVEAILAHELAHVMRKDFIFNILQSVVEALFYFHPAVWWLSSQIRNERESACDDIAIELINSKINYARALVAIQEMAYFPLTPSLAFAGQRKSQLMVRMQRILNQPNNKTNIMEKLIATCSLLLLMVGLTFGGNFNKNNTPSVSEPTSSDVEYEEVDMNSYLYLPQNADSLPVSTEVIDGIYKYEDNTQKAEMTVRDNYVVALKVNDIDLKDNQFINYKNLIDKVLRSKKPSNTPSVSNDVFAQQGIQMDEYRIHMNNDKANSKMGNNEFKSNDDNGNRFNMIIDENGLETSLDIAKEDNYTLDARPVEGTKQYNQNGKLEYIAGNDGSLRYYNEKGELTNYYLPNGDMKQYRNKKLVSIQKETGYTRNNRANTNLAPTTKKDPYNTLRFKADDGYSYVVFDLNGEKIWKCYRNEILLGDLVMKNDNRIYVNNRIATSTEMLNFGLVYYNNALNPKTGGFQIITVDKRGEWNTDVRENQNGYAYSYSTDTPNNNDLQADIVALQSDIKELRKEIKECKCEINFDFRMGLIEELDRLFPIASSRNRNVFNAFEKRFLDIKNRWERGECDDFKQNNGQNYNNNGNSSHLLDTRIKNIARNAERLVDAIDACNCKSKDPNWVIWAKARLNAQNALAQNNKNDYGLKMIENEIATIERQLNRLKSQTGSTNCEGCPLGNGQNYTVYSTTPNSYSYGAATSRADAERAQKDAAKRTRDAQLRSAEAQRQAQEARRISTENEQRARDKRNRAESSQEDSRQSKAMRSIFVNLKDMGFIELNKKCTIEVGVNHIRIDGNILEKAQFNRIKKDFEDKLGKKITALGIYFDGKIQRLSNDHLDMSGTFSNSLSTED
jgi:beta-lactamase regulating signal transducer with metallopeptidase domain